MEISRRGFLPLAAAGVAGLGINAASASEEKKDALKKPLEKVVFLSAHPDDMASSMGTALLMKGLYEVHVINYTHGERGCGEENFKSGRTRRTRTAEEEAVCKGLGAKLHWMEEVDGEAYASRETVAALAKLLKEINPRAVLTHWPIDVHIDHTMNFAAGMKAIELAGIRPEIYFHLQEMQSRSFPPFVYVDVSKVYEEKTRLISLYKSQNGDKIAKRKAEAQVHFGRITGYSVEWMEPFAIMTGTVGPGRTIFDKLPRTTF